jgi:hypothetical protein
MNGRIQMRENIDFQNRVQPTNILALLNRGIQIRQDNVDFQNRELPTNTLALLLVTTRRPQSEWRLGDTVCSPHADFWRAAA